MSCTPNSAEHSIRLRRQIVSAIAGLGFACVMTQLTLMREMLSAFAGNEMVFGVVLGLWLLLTGLGTLLGRTSEKLSKPLTQLAFGQVLIALVPICQVLALRTVRNIVLTRGSEIGITPTILWSAVLLLPFCLVTGYTLVLACTILTRANDPLGTGRVYVADSVGSIVGGVLFTFILVHWLDHIALLGISAVINLALAAWTTTQPSPPVAKAEPIIRKPPWGGLGVLLILCLTVMLIALEPDTFSTTIQFAGQRVLFKGNSPYGRLVVTAANGQTNFIENGVVVVYTPNIEQSEEAAHYAMCQRPDARRVLLVSGGAAGVTREILKYNVGAIDYVELDPLIVRVTRTFLPQHVTDERIHVFTTDARRFIRRTTNQYDVVILALPDPTTAQLNRFFTTEFFHEVKRALAKDGVIAFSLGRYENYISPELGKLLSSAYRTLRLSFRTVLMLPVGRVYFLASDGQLDPDIAGQIARAGIQTKFVNRNYLDAMLNADRQADMERAISYPAIINRDFNPVLYYYALRHWLSQFESGLGPVQLFLIIVLLVYTGRLRGAAPIIFASGFAGSALEVVLLLAVQVLCGSVYHQVGTIVTMFMVGLAIGAAVSNRTCGALTTYTHAPGQIDLPQATDANAQQAELQKNAQPHTSHAARKLLVLLALGICVLSTLLPLILKLLVMVAQAQRGELAVQCIIGLCTLILGGLIGAQFPLANWIESPGSVTASRLFTADFMGAFLGALIACTLLVPVLGVTASCLATAGLNLAAVVAMAFGLKRS